MSPTVGEVALAIAAGVLSFMVALRIIPELVAQLARYIHRSLDADYVERDRDYYDR